MAKVRSFLLISIALNYAKGHVAYIGLPNRLHQVAHGVYVNNPSVDGNSDLFVAATEDHGVKTSWLTDHPVNYLQPGQLPVAYTSTVTTTSLPREDIVTNQKRAVITSPQIKYAYSLPASDGNAQIGQYPYAVSATPAQTEGTECSDPAAVAAYPYPYALHWYYSQMMQAFANALNNVAKETTSEEAATSTSTTPATPAWPSYYPVQYVMVDPAAWAKSQAATTSTTTPAPSSASNESV